MPGLHSAEFRGRGEERRESEERGGGRGRRGGGKRVCRVVGGQQEGLRGKRRVAGRGWGSEVNLVTPRRRGKPL